MFPLRDDNPTLHRSVATVLVIVANAAVWLGLQGMGGEPELSRSVCEFGAIPGELLGRLPAGTTIALGRDAQCVLEGRPNLLTPLTSMFLHGGWFHVIGNLWFLWIFGDNVEDAMGPLRFLAFYLLCGFAAVAAQVASSPLSAVPMVGASGAIGGVMGAYALLHPRAPVHLLLVLGFYVTRIVVPAYFMLGYWLVIQLIGALPTIGGNEGGVAFWAHIGGFAAGALLLPLFRSKHRVDRRRAWLRKRGGGRRRASR